MQVQNLHRSATPMGQTGEGGGNSLLLHVGVVLGLVGFKGMIQRGEGCTSAGAATVDGTVGRCGWNHFTACFCAFLS